jgi:hypothetical protein
MNVVCRVVKRGEYKQSRGDSSGFSKGAKYVHKQKRLLPAVHLADKDSGNDVPPMKLPTLGRQ